ncbi:PASTA domain-containing protein [Sporolactobacillus sp. THM7-7]|nr:PASTA domain-containing protein [Sporolactobacillus sp. THM7-7]
MFQRKRKALSFWAGVVGLAFLIAFFIVIGRFVYIAQGKEIDGHELTGLGKKQWTQVDLINEKRGSIYSKNGKVLAEDVPAYTLYAVVSPEADSYVKNKAETARKLAPILGMKASDIQAILEKKAYQVEFGQLGKQLSYEKKKKIDALKLPGLGFLETYKRYYPEQSSAAYTIGFTQSDTDTNFQKGVFGIEQSLNDYLTEKDGSVSFYRSLSGVPIPGETKNLKKASPGNDVYLTLNSTIQTVLDQSMQNAYKKYKPESMIGIVLDPKTGQVMGMSSKPDFNLNRRDIEQFNNAPVSSRYEPGSVMKTFTLAAAIDAGVYRGNAAYRSGSYKFDGGTIHDWRRNGWGTITFNQGFQLSSNVGFSILADKYLGTDKLKQYFEKFGLNQRTGIDLPGEVSSRMNWNAKYDQIAASFGQGSAFTAMQIVQAATAIANDGTMMRPYIIDKVVDPKTDKPVLTHQPVIAGRPISKKAAEETRALMRKVVENKNVVNGAGATGRAYDLPGYDVIGKTGTSQLYADGRLLTGRDNYIYSFLGMAPEKDPKLIVYVAVKQPKLDASVLYDSQPVIDVVKPVMSSSLQYMKVKNEKDTGDADKEAPAVLHSFIGRPIHEAAQALKNQGMRPITLGEGTVERQMPYQGQEMTKDSRVILSGSGTKKIPDLRGWSLADSLKVAQITGMRPVIKGDGYVVDQRPAPGSAVKKGDTLTIQMGNTKEGDKEQRASGTAKSSPSETGAAGLTENP